MKRGPAKYAAAALLTVCALLLFAGCAGALRPGAEPSPDPGGPGFNGTDVMFLQMMLPHHGQGVRIVRLAEGRAVRPEVRTLAAAIEATQLTEITTMAGWLRAWRRPPRAPRHAHAAHGGLPETSESEIAALARATGPAFERAFLNTLIAHQDDAVQLARMQLADGIDPRVRDLARRMERSRSAQIKQMLLFLDNTDTHP
ncbi:Uncharacterized conserved protein, DUF305 family [Thermomonospora echinospora]|uniref:Uncharacterized conserved protein, DUF305 family n=1 Tax=Thermomonospora echinospora TaxID=1992 RepID=A0A1H6ECS9_9ACTN|nr:DUF305 domain-containing protein [Thermomonospora echinospora]SEG94829.1 Uncharacterized conserved protein, DUF305 family [Thermomonospora echinospora]